MRSRPCIYRIWHCFLENTCCFPFLLSVPTSFISSLCQKLGRIRSTWEEGWVPGHGGLTLSCGRQCEWVGTPTSPQLLVLSVLAGGREKRMPMAVPLCPMLLQGTKQPQLFLPGGGAQLCVAELLLFCLPAATACPRVEPGMPPQAQGLRAMEKCCPATVANYAPPHP